MKTNVVIKDSIVDIVMEMKKNREHNSVREYGTLLDSLTHFIPNLHGTESNQAYIYYIKEQLKKEESGISVLLKESMKNRQYKDYHRWTLIFNKLITTYNKLENEQSYYNYEPGKVKDKVKGKYVFVSGNIMNAAYKAKTYFNVNSEEEIDLKFSRKVVIDDYQIEIFALDDIHGLNGVRGNVLCIDKELTFDMYMKAIDPHIGGFEYTVLI